MLNDNCGGSPGLAERGARGDGSEAVLVVIEFRVGGNLRFLSHAEIMKVFQRACTRGGIEVRYSQGFNPRPRMSLPLPKTVGVGSEDDLLCLRIEKSTGAQEHKSVSELCGSIKARLSEQLPEGIELLSVRVAGPHSSFQPTLATYVLAVRTEYISDDLKARIESLLASESLLMERAVGRAARGASKKVKRVDVRGFLQSIKLHKEDIVVECKISPAGSIRVEEILELLELDEEKLAGSIRRTSTQWQVSE